MSAVNRKSIALLALGAAIALGGCATTGTPYRHPLQDREEARLAKLLEGRVPGKPSDCISAFDLGRMQIFDHTAIVYESGDTIWVARPSDPHSLDTSDIVVIKRTSSQLCKQDMIRTVDRTGHFTTGVVFLDDFVPYRKP